MPRSLKHLIYRCCGTVTNNQRHLPLVFVCGQRLHRLGSLRFLVGATVLAIYQSHCVSGLGKILTF